ncbi:hypothetical protein ACFWVM_17895 [Nocardia fluminea]|uniref:hypothetical protein n=1 Tax=Nocardia fluminea TaxID=134984 RepID=UPI003661F0B4
MTGDPTAYPLFPHNLLDPAALIRTLSSNPQIAATVSRTWTVDQPLREKQPARRTRHPTSIGACLSSGNCDRRLGRISTDPTIGGRQPVAFDPCARIDDVCSQRWVSIRRRETGRLPLRRPRNHRLRDLPKGEHSWPTARGQIFDHALVERDSRRNARTT